MNEEDIPIDIHYNKLLDWLVSRRHCQQQWQATALDIREKINSAIQDMPEHPEIIELLKGEYINYFHCERIVEILRETEAATKNVFGRYSSQRMKDWQQILSLYQQDNVFLAEAAQILTRNVNYEIPVLKKQVARCKQAQTDCNRKETEHASMSAEMNEKYYSRCKQMGVEGKKLKTELMALVRDLPATFEEIAASSKSLSSAIEFYIDFVAFTLNKNDFTAETLPLLRHIINKGNTTTYEYLHAKAPSKVEAEQESFRVDDEEAIDESKADEIDFGFEDEIDLADESAADIDWGMDDVQIDVVDDSMQDDDDVARGDEALTILDNVEMRNSFINELLELEGFLTQRQIEMEDTSDIVSSELLSGAPASMQVSDAVLQNMQDSTETVFRQLTSGRMQELMRIRSSPRYVHRLAERLRKLLDDSEKMASLSRLMVTRRREAEEMEMATQPKVKLLQKKTQKLKTQIASELSKKYKGRRVNIMGEVNTV